MYIHKCTTLETADGGAWQRSLHKHDEDTTAQQGEM